MLFRSNAGVSPKVVQLLARHSTIRLTMDRYTHVESRSLLDAVANLPDLLNNPSEVATSLSKSVMQPGIQESGDTAGFCVKPYAGNETPDEQVSRGPDGPRKGSETTKTDLQKGRNTEINMKNARAKLVVLCTVDENGKRIFGDADIALLADKSAKALDRIFSVAQELSGISKDDMEELTENFDETTSGG